MGILDSLSKNPALLALGALGIGLFIFRDKISGFFSDITGGAEAAATLGSNFNSNLQGIQDITEGINTFLADPFAGFEFPTLPAVTLPTLPAFEFPTFEFPNFDNIFTGIGDFIGGIFPPAEATPSAPFDGSEGFIGPIAPPIIPTAPIQTDFEGGVITVPAGNELGFGGGPSFIGGETTFGSNIVDTLSEVLNLFPNLTASQAADALAANQGLTGSEFALINPDVINISNIIEGGDTGPVTSGDFTGLTPEQIAQLLTGGNITNF